MKAIDVHAHILSDETMRLLQEALPSLGVKHTATDADFGVLEVAGTAYRPFPRGGWDLDRRLEDMDTAEVDMQVVSNTPQTFLYKLDAQITATTSRIQNDQIAKLVSERPDRFMGLATLPMQAPELAAQELARSMRQLGLKGCQIGSNVNGKNLDDPALAPLWKIADELSAFIMVHPTQVAGADRLKSYYLANLIGNPLDTTIAAASLVFGGVVERYPAIRFFMVHGGGFAPYQAGRWSHGWQVRDEPKVNLKQPPDAAIRRLYFDTILHGKPALEFLVATFGASHVLLGSDYPYDMGTLECVRQVRALSIPEADRATILSGLALDLLAPADPRGKRQAGAR
ncbi:MAG: amidohydrolase family protein [Xanthobacteraceae bacterium]|jgi:aminocarboxymuconate-semialdehyde decarboxylase